MPSKIQNPKSKILVVGAGPAGASLAIRLAKENFRVCLIERENFPRPKLCGEFISPECLEHFRDLDVLDEMLELGGDCVKKIVFYAANGKSVSVASEWFGGDYRDALSVSRAEMDFRLLRKAKEAGVEVLEETSAVNLLIENKEVRGVRIRTSGGNTREISAALIVDATGRANVLNKFTEREFSREDAENSSRRSAVGSRKILNPNFNIQNRLVGFKTHLENVYLEKGVCEIYFFRGGYGGLSRIENNLANHCFLIKADVVKKFSGDARAIVEDVICENRRAFKTLRNAAPVSDWLAVSIDNFGVKNLCPAKNLFSIGDAAAFIDPFTGSGMLMALESAEILARTIARHSFSTEKIAEEYEILHKEKFRKRLRFCSLLRRAAFIPNLAKTVISVLSLSEKASEIAARSTRENF